MEKFGCVVLMLLVCFIFNVDIAQAADKEEEAVGKKSDEKKEYGEKENKENKESTGEEKICLTLKEKMDVINQEVNRRISRIKPDELAQLAKELLQKKEDLEKKEIKLKEKEEQLEINERELMVKITKVESVQQKILGCVDNNKKMEDERTNHMVTVISNMRPAQAAEVLSVQDPVVAIKIVASLDPLKASKIFNLMDKEISARIQKQYLDMKK